MSAPFTRDLSITYAGVTIGGSDEYNLLFDTHRVFGSYEEIGVEARVLVRGSTAAEFATKCAALETAFQTPNGTLVISQESQTLRSLGHSANTGFLGRPSFSKVGGPEDTGRSRLYNVAVRAKRPADLSGKSGLQIAEFELQTSFFSVRTYRVTGTFTALSSTAAKAQYESAIAAFLTTLETSLTGNWQRMAKSVRWDDENKVATFTQEGFEEGLREGSYQIFTTQTGLRSYRVEGTYTATAASGGAQASYAAAIGTLLTTFETGLTGTWLRGASTTQRDQADKLVRFSYEAVETGLRDAVYSADAEPSGRRRYRVSGKYEKAGATGATATYAAAIAAVLTTWEGTLGGTWERVQSRYAVDQTDTVIDFEWNGLEVIYNQASGALDSAAIKNPQMVVVRRSVAPGDYVGTKRPTDLVVTYDASIDKSVTQDLKGLWDGTIKPWLVQHARALANSAQAALIEVDPGFDYASNTIRATLVVQTYEATVLAHVVETEDRTITGVALVGVWSGDPDEFAEFQGQRVRLRTITEEITRLGSPSAPALGSGTAADGRIDAGGGSGLTSERGSGATLPGVGAKEAGYRLLETTQISRPERRGLDELGVDVVTERFVHVLQYRNPSNGKGGGGSSGDGRIESGVT